MISIFQLFDTLLNCSDHSYYLCNECLTENFCNICSKPCIDGCIQCDSCHKWIHYKCSKMTRGQIISYSRSNKDYYCQLCISSSLPFGKLTNEKLNILNQSNSIALAGPLTIDSPSSNKDNPCNLCLECNPECTSCDKQCCPNSDEFSPCV